jgi:hypothetical protein
MFPPSMVECQFVRHTPIRQLPRGHHCGEV